MDNKVRTKGSKQLNYVALICLVLFIFLLYKHSFFIFPWNQGQYRSYFEYFLNYRLPDFTTQMTLIILSITFFVKSLKRTDRARITIIASVWCFVGAFVSLAWSFGAYFQYPIPHPIGINVFYVRYILPGLLSLLVLLGTSIFFIVTRNYTEKKILRPKFVKKASLVDSKIDSDTRKNILEKISTSNLKDLINSLTCVKCSSIAKLSFYTIIEKSSSRDAKRDTSYKPNSFEIPVCDSCRGFYDSWYSIHRKINNHFLRTIFKFIFILFFFPTIFLFIFLLFLPSIRVIYYIFGIFLYLFFLLLPLVGVIILIVSIVKRTLSFSNQNSPYKNVKLKWGNKVLVRPDNFKKWASLQDWVLYSLKTHESGKIQLSEIESILLNYLNEHKGSAFSPRALVKRAIGENFTEEYVEIISKLLKKMTEKEIINYNYHDGKPHYVSS